MKLGKSQTRLFKELRKSPYFNSFEELGARLKVTRQRAEVMVSRLQDLGVIRLLDAPRHHVVFPDIPIDDKQ